MFVVECDTEVVLVRTLTSVSRRDIEHSGGKSRVVNDLIKRYENSIGLIDQDPNSSQPRDIQRFTETDSSERDRLRIFHHSRRNNRLIILCPRLEEWIIEASREANIDLNKYKLPNNPNQLHEIINIKSKLEEFQRLIEELMQISDRVKALKNRLTEQNWLSKIP